MASKKSGKDAANYKHMAKTPKADNMYNAKGSPEEGEAMDEEAGMKKGGRAKKHSKVEGAKSKGRADMKSRHKRASGGRTPYTSGHMTSEPSESSATNSGHESQRPSS